MPYNLSTLENGCKELGIELSQKQKDQFIQFYEFLVEKNKVMNLTGITEFEEVLTKHFLDSLSCVKAIDMTKVKTIMDIGNRSRIPGSTVKDCIPASGSLSAGLPEEESEFSGGKLYSSRIRRN